eukprot:6213745-Pleurochrysis_carterae.AAC.7
MANSPAGIHSYFDVITIFAALGAVATFLFFRERCAQDLLGGRSAHAARTPWGSAQLTLPPQSRAHLDDHLRYRCQVGVSCVCLGYLLGLSVQSISGQPLRCGRLRRTLPSVNSLDLRKLRVLP